MSTENALNKIRSWLNETGHDGILVPSTDDFLSEFAPPANRYLRWASGFTGSTGIAAILRNAAGLFLDSRYFAQGVQEGARLGFEAVASAAVDRENWLRAKLPDGGRLALDPSRFSAVTMDEWRSIARDTGFELALLQEDPFASLWAAGRPAPHRPRVEDYPPEFAGLPFEVKCADAVAHVRETGLSALLVADPEDLSWLFNVRADSDAIRVEPGEWHIVPVSPSCAVVHKAGVEWFVDGATVSNDVQARRGVTVLPPASLGERLKALAMEGPVGGNPNTTPAALAAMITARGTFRPDDSLARRRWVKAPDEQRAARVVHTHNAVAVIRLLAWLDDELPRRRISEFEAAVTLETFRRVSPLYRGPSMPAMSASGASGSLPHYVPPRQGGRILNDHPIYWLDSGGQYAGGSTDNTVTFAFGRPEPKHVLAHTLVLKGLIALTTQRFPEGTTGMALDVIARGPLWAHGMDYGHATGHGVGNQLNIHEGPVIGRSPSALTLAGITPGMILANEPGFYLEGDFGVRIESHMLVVPSPHEGFLDFETISRLPIDPVLVDASILDEVERQWLRAYHAALIADLGPLLDDQALSWLKGRIGPFLTSD